MRVARAVDKKWEIVEQAMAFIQRADAVPLCTNKE
jgi:hypothetical protein